MTKEQWNKVAAEMVPHLEALQWIASDNQIYHFDVSIYGDGRAYVWYINPESKAHYHIGKIDGCYESDCDFEPIGKYEIKKALTPGSN